MPTANGKVKIKFGTEASYNNATKDSNTIYVTTDKNRLYVGSSLITKEAFSGSGDPSAALGCPGSLYLKIAADKISVYIKSLSGWVNCADLQSNLGYTPANKAGDTFTGTMAFNSYMKLVATIGSGNTQLTYNGNTKTIVADNATDISLAGVKVSKEGHTHTNLDTSLSKGSATNPVYVQDGEIKATTYQLNKTVPANAVFTDTVYTHPTTSGNKHIPSGGSSGQILEWSANGTAKWATPAASVTVDSEMSSTSTNPVQNKIVDAAIKEKSKVILKTWTAEDVTT